MLRAYYGYLAVPGRTFSEAIQHISFLDGLIPIETVLIRKARQCLPPLRVPTSRQDTEQNTQRIRAHLCRDKEKKDPLEAILQEATRPYCVEVCCLLREAPSTSEGSFFVSLTFDQHKELMQEFLRARPLSVAGHIPFSKSSPKHCGSRTRIDRCF